MCGRYLRRSDKQRIAEAFRLGELPEGFVLLPDRAILIYWSSRARIDWSARSGSRSLAIAAW